MSDDPSAISLDATDHRIIAELLEDGRISVRELADRLHISRANAYARLTRLQSDGVITGFTASISHDKAGLKTSAFIAMSIHQDAWRDIAKALATMPYIEHFGLIGGEVDVLVLVRACDNNALRELVLERLHGLGGVQSTKTWLIFDESPGKGAPWGDW
jgi:DNA-binding Lrp family transcriptional regulator